MSSRQTSRKRCWARIRVVPESLALEDAVMPPWVFIALAAANLWTFLLFGWDKLCARRNVRRISEATLLWWLFLGSPIGAWLAMRMFRHKTVKSSFRWRAIVLSILNPLWLILVLHFWRR